jgi:hypothetical protein
MEILKEDNQKILGIRKLAWALAGFIVNIVFFCYAVSALIPIGREEPSEVIAGVVFFMYSLACAADFLFSQLKHYLIEIMEKYHAKQ